VGVKGRGRSREEREDERTRGRSSVRGGTNRVASEVVDRVTRVCKVRSK
jgi:hypothetical protein